VRGNLRSEAPMSRPPRPALLLIDLVNRFDFEGGDALAKATLAASGRILALRERFDAAGLPVIYANDNFMHWQGEFRDLVAACRAMPGPAARIAERLAPGEGHYYVLKPKHSAFMASALPVLLAQLRVDALVLAGEAADSCVLATALDAKMREFRVWAPSDCTAANTPLRKQRALALLRASVQADTRASRAVRGTFPAPAD
jgi:nicotinamidase-related amidase